MNDLNGAMKMRVKVLADDLNDNIKDLQSSLKIFFLHLYSFLFPDKFKFTPYIVLSMGCLLSGIYLYETKKKATSTNTTTQEQLKK